jgi:squalene synthase HpnC
VVVRGDVNGAAAASPAGARGGPDAVLAEVGARSAAQMGAENFPVALRLVPRRPREHLARVYSFARFVDDVGDEAPGDRLGLLDRIDSEVRALSTGAPTLPAVAGLLPVVEDCGVPVEIFLDLIEANRTDQRTTRYQSFDDLLGYCALSAAPVGQIVLHIAHVASERNVAESNAVCAGLQVLEHCQDVGEDARAGRVYLPAAELRAAGVLEDDLLAATASAPLRRVIALQVDRATELVSVGRSLVRRLPGWSRMAVAGYVAGGLATASALRAAEYDVLAQHVRPTKTRTAAHAVRLMAGVVGRG